MASHILICVLLFTCVHAATEFTECHSDAECFQHQLCSYGRCKCETGYIPNIRHCFKIRHYGQDCAIPEQCTDFRMVCEAPAHDPLQIKRCICDGLHEWNSASQTCEQSKNFTKVVGQLEEKTKWAEEIAKDGNRVFFGLVIAGLVAIFLLLLFAIFCVIYGCCFRNIIDGSPPKADTEKLTAQQVAATGSPKEGTYMVIPTDLDLV